MFSAALPVAALILVLLQAVWPTTALQAGHHEGVRLGTANASMAELHKIKRSPLAPRVEVDGVAQPELVKAANLTATSRKAQVTAATTLRNASAEFLSKHTCAHEPTIAAAWQAMAAKGRGRVSDPDLAAAAVDLFNKGGHPALFYIEHGRADFTIIVREAAATLLQDKEMDKLLRDEVRNSTASANTEHVVPNSFKVVGLHAKKHGQNASMSDAGMKADIRRAEFFKQMLNRLLAEVTLPNMKFLLCLNDIGASTPYIFYNEGHPGSDLLFLPRSLLAFELREGRRFPDQCLGTRKSVAVFRGATTGSYPWMIEPVLPLRDRFNQVAMRYKIADLSKRRPDLLDAGFTSVTQVEPGHESEVKSALQKGGLMKGYLDDSQQQCFAAVVVPDGNTQADRLPRQMMYGIPVVVVHEHTKPPPGAQHPLLWNDEFWYGEPQNGRDWLMIHVEELEGTLERLLSDPQKMSMLGKSARAYAQDQLSVRRSKCYVYQLLSEYAKHYSE
mmetsp:Transcript_6300/g.10618  ORF Transcript_6300/g.10618 Transcript_6300/m.10618 type:complete len:502 (-) Transcript_6300:15-1520(-)